MSEEMKMSNRFNLPLYADGYLVKSEPYKLTGIPDSYINEIECTNGEDAEYVCHAINNHDRLVEENSRLTELAAQKASRADELFEALECQLSTLIGYRKLMIHPLSIDDDINKVSELLDKIKQESNDE